MEEGREGEETYDLPSLVALPFSLSLSLSLSLFSSQIPSPPLLKSISRFGFSTVVRDSACSRSLLFIVTAANERAFESDRIWSPGIGPSGFSISMNTRMSHSLFSLARTCLFWHAGYRDVGGCVYPLQS